jgi:hypothetical protein
MFLLDSLMISGIRWALETAVTAAEAEMNDDGVLREQLLEAEMRRETGELSDEAFAEIEADLLARIREIKARREGGAGPLAFEGAQPMETTPDSRFQVEASVSGDFYDSADAPHTTVVDHEPPSGGLIGVREGQALQVMDLESKGAAPRRRRPAARPARPRARRSVT